MKHKVLDKIDSPADLKTLSLEELKTLTQEIRQMLVETVSRTGGHLASNLGVVELTIGLHLALESPKDKIIWDVGHQCYIHKLLTGRKKRFETLRQFGGLAGFPKRSESEHDIFDTGHASNSISCALGLAEARDKRGGDETICAVIGDGSLTGGIAYEALNQAGHLKTRLIALLNDNNMSIAHNVGAMSTYLSRIRLDPAYNKLRDEIEQWIKKIPAVGEIMYTLGEQFRDGLKHLLIPGMIFEELGWKYVGPINGQDIDLVKRSVNLAKQINGPVLIHVLTKKGAGFSLAENSPDEFHGAPPFIISTGEPLKKSEIPTYTEVFGDTMIELAENNERIVAITAAMANGTGLERFARTFPDRFYDVGIAEQHAVTFAAGLALDGLIPVVAIYSTFLERAFDQIIQDICLQNLHVVFALDRAGLVGEDGPTHHGVFDLSYLRQIPVMVVMAPKDEQEFRRMLYTAISSVSGPVAIRYPRGLAVGVATTRNFETLEIGEAEVLEEGNDVCLIAIGNMVRVAQEAASILRRKEISATVINARFAKPIDKKVIMAAANKHRLVVTLEENTIIGGFGSGVAEILAENGVVVPLLRLGLPDKFVEHGATEILLSAAGLDAAGVAQAVERKLNSREKRLKPRLINQKAGKYFESLRSGF